MDVAVFGGSFDPVHQGHVAVADAVMSRLRPDLLLWVPARQAPHKPGQILASDDDRVALLRLVVTGRPGEDVCLLELRRPGPSYTVDTLDALAREHPTARFTLVLGADSLEHLPAWRDLPRLFAAASLAVVPRPGFGAEALERLRSRLVPDVAARLRARFLPMVEVPISATEIRARLRCAEPCDDWLPPGVAAEIRSRRLYTGAA